jgi:hypothetical protein
MRNRGLANAKRVTQVSVGVAIAAGLAIWWGIHDMLINAGRETAFTGIAIGFGIFIGVFALLFVFNGLWAMRIAAAMRRGEGVVAKWTIAPATFELFREQEARLRSNGEDNDYPLPRKTPPEGLPVVFNQDGVMIGDRFFGLASTGMARFAAVALRQGVPDTLEFSTVLTTAYAQPRVSIQHHRGQLRIPVDPRSPDEARKVLAHYEAVVARRIIVKPHFWTVRIRVGLVAAVLGALAFGIGMALREQSQYLYDIPLYAAVVGAILGVAGLILAFIASVARRFQRGR